MDKEARAVIVISSLAPAGRKRLKVLYRALETVSVEISDHMLKPVYGSYTVLAGAKAGPTQLTNAVLAAGSQPTIGAIDVVVVLHGSPGRLIFDDGNGKGLAVDATAVAATFAPARAKLRMLYSTACYGLSHAQAFVDGGFIASVWRDRRVRQRTGGVPAGAGHVVPQPHVQGLGRQGGRSGHARHLRHRRQVVRVPPCQQRQGDQGHRVGHDRHGARRRVTGCPSAASGVPRGAVGHRRRSGGRRGVPVP